jgi:hypothetical protein
MKFLLNPLFGRLPMTSRNPLAPTPSIFFCILQDKSAAQACVPARALECFGDMLRTWEQKNSLLIAGY